MFDWFHKSCLISFGSDPAESVPTSKGGMRIMALPQGMLIEVKHAHAEPGVGKSIALQTFEVVSF